MEAEAEYQRVLSFLEQLRSINANLDEQELLSSYVDTTSAIEAHFENCIRALLVRKSELLSDAASKLQLCKKAVAGQQKEVNDSIHGCTRILEGGSLLFNTNRDVAISLWRNIASIKVPQVEAYVIGVQFTEILADAINSNGTVTCETKRIVRAKAGFVSSVPLSKEPDSQMRPTALQFSPQEGLYVCDFSANIIKKISLEGTVTPITGASHFKSVGGIAINQSIIYASDPLAHTIKKRITSFFGGTKVDVLAGNGCPGDVDGIGNHASFKNPGALAVDQLTGDVYVADVGNHKIRKITPIGVVTTLAGSGVAGVTDGTGISATLHLDQNTPISFCNKRRVLFVADGNYIRSIALDGKVHTLPCRIDSPRGLVALPDGGFIVSSSKHKIYHANKKAKDNYNVTVLAGSGEAGNVDGTPFLCKFHTPQGLAFDESSNTCFVADLGNNSIRKFTLV